MKKDIHLVKEMRSSKLTVQLTGSDRAMLEELRVKMSPLAPLSLGKTLSVVIQLASQHFKARK